MLRFFILKITLTLKSSSKVLKTLQFLCFESKFHLKIENLLKTLCFQMTLFI